MGERVGSLGKGGGLPAKAACREGSERFRKKKKNSLIQHRICYF